ncbi:hypothetical protein PVAP13_4KG111435 [Panicum virgatum]|uniref:Uncharacterized protein n=1 Tax=Panicum virgatum TaxID=38727 RepID=A0A8T0TSH5_PANVG|nr:hypothetical protein PVAP13_4KG111435 [Panicum virgatum]
MPASLRVVAAAFCIVVILSSTAQLAVAPTVPAAPTTVTAAQEDACNRNCATACNAVGNAACPGDCFGNPVNAGLCTTCKTGANNECIPQCNDVCYSNPDPSITS